MILIVGGAHSGKRDFACAAFGLTPRHFSDDVYSDAPGLQNLQNLLRDGEAEALLPLLAQKQFILCDEVGCGVVPIDPAQALWRERVGAVCCRLAAQAQTVVRVQCGLGVAIKGALPQPDGGVKTC